MFANRGLTLIKKCLTKDQINFLLLKTFIIPRLGDFFSFIPSNFLQFWNVLLSSTVNLFTQTLVQEGLYMSRVWKFQMKSVMSSPLTDKEWRMPSVEEGRCSLNSLSVYFTVSFSTKFLIFIFLRFLILFQIIFLTV